MGYHNFLHSPLQSTRVYKIIGIHLFMILWFFIAGYCFVHENVSANVFLEWLHVNTNTLVEMNGPLQCVHTTKIDARLQCGSI